MNSVPDATDPNRGAGIGLYLSKLFAKMNQGELEVSSTEGKGTTITMILLKAS
jgi:signal transduction histidine kinase